MILEEHHINLKKKQNINIHNNTMDEKEEETDTGEGESYIIKNNSCISERFKEKI